MAGSDEEATEHLGPRAGRREKAAQRPTPISLERGATVAGRYVVVDAIGRGSMGAVMLAHDVQLVRRVALKVLLATDSTDEGRLRMIREAKALAQLSHPNVVTIYDVGMHNGNVYLAMEYVGGESLTAWLKTSRSWREVLAVMAQAGEGLRAAHKAGMIHRDFKPDNVVLGSDGHVRVIDFGIAASDGSVEPVSASGPSRVVSLPPAPYANADSLAGEECAPAAGTGVSQPRSPEPISSASPVGSSETLPGVFSDKLTLEGTIVGTVGYFAPEITYERFSARSDVFSFSAALYRALYQAMPFDSESFDVYLNALGGRIVRSRPAQSAVPYWVHEAVTKGLRCDPRERFASMDDVLVALARDPTKQRRRLVAASALAGLLVAGGATGWTKHVHSRRSVAAECAAGDAIMGATWSPTKRDAVRAALSRPGIPDNGENAGRTIGNLDAYASSWTAAYRAASETALVHERETKMTLDARLECLDEQRAEFETLTDAMAQADDSLALDSVRVTYSLAPPERCLGPSALRGGETVRSSPEARRRALAWRKDLARAEALELSGRLDQAQATVERVVGEAEAVSERGIEAHALKLLGMNREARQQFSAALPSYYRALSAAEAAGDEITATWLAAEIAFVLADELGRVKDAEPWLSLAHGILAHEGPNDALESVVLGVEGSVLSDSNQVELALAGDPHLIELRSRIFGPEHPETARAINNYAIDLSDGGRPEESLPYFRRSIDLLERAWGARQPRLVLYYENYARALGRAGHTAEALDADEHALALNARRGESVFLVEILSDIAKLSAVKRDWPASEAAARRALAIAQAAEDTKPLVGRVLTILGLAILGRGGDTADARAKCLQAITLPNQIEFEEAEGLRCVGEAALSRGDTNGALAAVTKAEAESHSLSLGDRGLLHFAHARALFADKRDYEGARVLAESARQELGTDPSRSEDAADVERWLASDKPEDAVTTSHR